MPSPIGDLTLVADGEGLCAVIFGTDGRPLGGAVTDPTLRAAVTQLTEYFAGRRTTFTVPLSLAGTAFERRVWQALTTIAHGDTRTYGEIAAQVGQPGAARAVGLANNHNPVPIIVPCHRVIGAGRKLVGYGGGLDRKKFLLHLEAKVGIERDFGSAMEQ